MESLLDRLSYVWDRLYFIACAIKDPDFDNNVTAGSMLDDLLVEFNEHLDKLKALPQEAASLTDQEKTMLKIFNRMNEKNRKRLIAFMDEN